MFTPQDHSSQIGRPRSCAKASTSWRRRELSKASLVTMSLSEPTCDVWTTQLQTVGVAGREVAIASKWVYVWRLTE